MICSNFKLPRWALRRARAPRARSVASLIVMMLSFAPAVVTATTATAVLTYCFMVALPRPSRHSFLFSLFVSRPPLALDVQNIAWACGGYYPPRPMRECRRPRRLARTHCAIRSTAMGMHLWLERRVPGRTPYLTARNAGTMTSRTGADALHSPLFGRSRIALAGGHERTSYQPPRPLEVQATASALHRRFAALMGTSGCGLD